MCGCYLIVVEGYTSEQAYADLIAHGDRSRPEWLAQKKALFERLARNRQEWLERVQHPTTTTNH